MHISSVAVLYFSPTGSTKTILNTLLEGMDLEKVTFYDLTLPQNREKPINIIEDLFLIGMPFYYSQIPVLVRPSIEKVSGEGQPTFLVAVYGNVSDGFVLDQLDSAIGEKGFQVIGGASFVAEHSFSSEDFPIAHGRPDTDDLQMARDLGAALIKKVTQYTRFEKFSKPIFRKPSKILPVPNLDIVKHIVNQPTIDLDTCTNCKICATHCPTGAIDQETLIINEDLCIRCFACVKNCPNHARTIEFIFIPPFFKKAQQKRRDPRIYL